jgi:DNA-binding NarL/FixJ family response regulator
MSRLNILIADLHDVMRRGLCSLMTSQPGWSVCGEVKSGLAAVKLASELKPDVVILGPDLTELNGIETTRQIKRHNPSIEILFYSDNNEDHVITEAFRSGIRGHVLKSDSEETLIDAVSALGRHEPFLSTRASETLLIQMLKLKADSEQAYALTVREREIVRLLSEGRSNKEIGSHLHISVKTVEAHRATVMRKLGYTSITELVRYAIRNGLVQP